MNILKLGLREKEAYTISETRYIVHVMFFDLHPWIFVQLIFFKAL